MPKTRSPTPRVERVSVLKSARIGFATIMVGAIVHSIVREPSPILVLMPTESDARGLCDLGWGWLGSF